MCKIEAKITGQTAGSYMSPRPVSNGMRILRYIGAAFVLLVACVGTAHAQISLGQLASVEIHLSPEHPQPGQLVEATVTSASEDVRASTIVWLLDDEIQEQGAGNTSFSFIADSLGSSHTLTALVKTPSGYVLSKSISLEPVEVTLLWEAGTYTPPFYRGRALYSSGSTVRAEAVPNFVLPNGTRLNSDELIYTWSKNGTVLGDVSGIGASSLVTDGPKFFGDYVLSVEVATQDGTHVARSAARVTTEEPRVMLYEYDPLIGTAYHKGLTDNYAFSGSSQIQLHAAPYFMDVSNENSGLLEYTWYVNNTKVEALADSPSILNVQLSAVNDITTNIRVVAEHLRHLLQSGESVFAVTFEGTARNSLFGF